MPSHDATRAFKLFFGPERVEPRPVYGDKAPHETPLSSPLRNCKRQIGGLVAMRDENLVRLGLALLRRDQVYLLTIARLSRRIVRFVINKQGQDSVLLRVLPFSDFIHGR